jgi:hypothetical protein
MKRVVVFLVASLTAVTALVASASAPVVEFKRAQLRVEVNSTDGDAGFQIDLDHEPWRSVTLRTPDGQKILDVINLGVLRGYGLTELFSESSEPPFTEFPLAQFKKLFPEGDYVLEGVAIDGTLMRSIVTLTHDFPAGPKITAPIADSTVGADELVVRWKSVTRPAGIKIVAYEVLVVSDADPVRVFSVDLPANATSVAVPAEFLLDGDYKVEVLAIEKSGNQSLSEIAFTVG